MMARTPDLSCAWSLPTSKPRRESISSWFRTRSGAPSGAAFSKVSAALGAASSGLGVSSAICTANLRLLNDHFLEQHVAHLVGRSRHIDAAQQLFLQAQHAGRPLEIVQ